MDYTKFVEPLGEKEETIQSSVEKGIFKYEDLSMLVDLKIKYKRNFQNLFGLRRIGVSTEDLPFYCEMNDESSDYNVQIHNIIKTAYNIPSIEEVKKFWSFFIPYVENRKKDFETLNNLERTVKAFVDLSRKCNFEKLPELQRELEKTQLGMNENTGGFYLKPKETSIDELRMYLGEEKKRKAKLLDNISPKGIEISGITEDPLVSYTGYTDFGDSVEDDYVDEFYLDDNEPLDF